MLKSDKATLTEDNTVALSTFGDIGEIKWDLSLCLLLSWIIVFACLSKGIKSSGKVVYFTAIYPYVILAILFGVGLSLPGSGDGIKLYLTPDMEKIKETEVYIKENIV